MNLSIDLDNFSMNKKRNTNKYNTINNDINDSTDDLDEFERFEGGFRDAKQSLIRKSIN
jgi:hypothetical protein